MSKGLSTLLLFAATVAASCGSYRQVPYFQDVDRSNGRKEVIQNYSLITIQPEDILDINVSSLNAEASAVFNSNNIQRAAGSSQDVTPTGYIVDQKGEIHFPLLGTIKTSGKTTFQLREEIRNQLKTYLTDPVVNIRFLNFRISVMGDVMNPGVYSIPNQRITITEALSMAGDLNITAKRTNVLLIRERDGNREFIPLDLTSRKIFESTYYYLKNNDLIYVQPDRTRYATVERSYRNISLLLSAASIAAIIITRN